MHDEEVVVAIDRYEQLIQREQTAQYLLTLLKNRAEKYAPITFEEVRTIAELFWLLPEKAVTK